MSRYHVNPTTGRVGKCQAKKQCRFHLSPEEHYPTPAAAQEAYAQQQEVLPSQLRKGRAVKESSPSPLETKEGLLESLHQTYEELITRVPHLRPITEALEAELQKATTPLAYLAFEARESERSRELWREGREEEATLHRLAFSLTRPLVERESSSHQSASERNFLTKDFGQKKDMVLTDPAEYYRLVEEELSLEMSYNSTVGESWPQEEDHPLTVTYSNGRQGTVRDVFLQKGPEAYQGDSQGESAYTRASQELAKAGGELLTILEQERGVTTRIRYEKAAERGQLRPPYQGIPVGKDFLCVGAGIDYNAFLHRSSGMVFKVAHEENSDLHYYCEREGLEKLKEATIPLQRQEEEAYARVAVDALEEEGLEYCPTLFLQERGPSGATIALTAQPYLSPKEWCAIDLLPLTEGLAEKGQVGDLHDGNCRLEKATGRVVIIDGLRSY